MAVGFQTLFHNKSGGFNVALGNGSLLQNTSGSNNIALGVDAGANLTTGNDNICIDHPGIAGDSGMIRLGTAGTPPLTPTSPAKSTAMVPASRESLARRVAPGPRDRLAHKDLSAARARQGQQVPKG